jgi:hypothetical protein
MRNRIRTVLEKQAAWQRSRADMSWADKLRASVSMRRGLESLKKRPLPLKSREATPGRTTLR